MILHAWQAHIPVPGPKLRLKAPEWASKIPRLPHPKTQSSLMGI